MDTKTVSGLIQQQLANAAALKQLFTSFLYLLKIFYSLNAVDLPEFFEDNLKEFMTHMKWFLVFESTLPELVVNDKDDEKPGLLQRVQTWICQIISLYVGKYEEEFEPYLQAFAKDIWSLLMKVGPQPNFDKVNTFRISFHFH